MRYLRQAMGLAAFLALIVPCRGETINISTKSPNIAAENAAGIHVTPTGPDDLPAVQGELQVLGMTSPFLNNSITSRYYSGLATMQRPATEITLVVGRENNSGWENPITLTGFDNGKKVASQTMNLGPLGESTTITISAPAIDKFTWSGQGWVYHPYFVRDMQVTLDSASVASAGPRNLPSVGSTPVPEPAVTGVLGIVAMFVLAKRRKRDWSGPGAFVR